MPQGASGRQTFQTNFDFDSDFQGMSLMGNVIKTVRSTGPDYWAADVGGEKIKTDGLKQHTRTDVITL